MFFVHTKQVPEGNIVWQFLSDSRKAGREGLSLVFQTPAPDGLQRRAKALERMRKAFSENGITWIKPGPSRWTINLDSFADYVGIPDSAPFLVGSKPNLKVLPWFRGVVALEPEFEPEPLQHFGLNVGFALGSVPDVVVAFHITPNTVNQEPPPMEPPIEIVESLTSFQRDHPEPAKAAFVMMPFGTTKAHGSIVEGIRAALGEHGIDAVRADDKDYHQNKYWNVLTYIWGCRFGVAVFEWLEKKDFNPNVSLEVGYFLALRKPVCLLKDRTLPNLPGDIVDMLYKEFDPQDAATSIPEQLLKWCRDWNLLQTHPNPVAEPHS